jgi:hypothetical protein
MFIKTAISDDFGLVSVEKKCDSDGSNEKGMT